jgi:hypothetical protein
VYCRGSRGKIGWSQGPSEGTCRKRCFGGDTLVRTLSPAVLTKFFLFLRGEDGEEDHIQSGATDSLVPIALSENQVIITQGSA